MTFTSISPENQNQEPLKLNWLAVIFFAIIHLLVLLTPWF
jgi:stearoyl-CoA desaturase (delta-9 desaturase)